jgi:predicted GIY-YIG superfamily endonuclease
MPFDTDKSMHTPPADDAHFERPLGGAPQSPFRQAEMRKVGFKPSIMTCTASTSSRRAYAGSSGRVEERLRRHFRGYSSAANRGLRPDATYVSACTRSRSLALSWEAWLHRAHRPSYAARAPAERPRKPPHPGGTPPAPRSVSPNLQVPYRGRPVSLYLWGSIYVQRA